MPSPTSSFKKFLRTKATTDLDTKAERIGATVGWGSADFSTVDTGANPLDFGTVDISGGANNSLVFYLAWKPTAANGNTLADNFRLWDETGSPDYWGFTQAGTNLKMAPMKFESGGANGQLYVINAVTGTYSWGNINQAGAPSQNVYSGAGGTSVDLSSIGSTEDIVSAALYLAIATGETTGTYQGVTSGKEFRGSFRYDYS